MTNIIIPNSPIKLAVERATLFFKTLHIQTSHEKVAHEMIDGYLSASMAGIDGQLQGLSIFMPSHFGKSSIVSGYVRTRVVPAMIQTDPAAAKEPVENLINRQKTILHVTLTEDATPSSVAIDILKALNPEAPVTGNKATLWHRVHRQCKLFGVLLLVLDEIQHLAGTGMKIENGQVVKIDQRRTRSTPDSLKVILQRGSIPLLFVGVMDARKLLIGAGSTQFNGRIDEIPMHSLDWTIDEDRNEFLMFSGRVAKAMAAQGLVKSAPRLVHGDTPLKLFIASNGRLGLLCKILKQALTITLSEQASELTLTHLQKAVDIVCVAREEIGENPFNKGAITQMELAS